MSKEANGHQRFAERMFPAPVDHGIAQPDRAVSTVEHGTDTASSGDWQNVRWYHGGGQIGERAIERITVYPPTRGQQTQGDPFEPAKIGVLVDMDIGQLLADWIDPTILAIEDALNEGLYDRPVEIVTVDARGLPRENYRKVQQGYLKLVEEGCLVVLGPMISDNSVALCDLVNATGVACIGWTGAVRFSGDYCFTVANGDIPEEGAMCANWCLQNGHERVGFFWEKGSSGTDYAHFFRQTAAQIDLDIVKEVSLGPNPRGLQEHLETMRAQGAEAIAYVGYGYATFHFADAFKALDWDPPRVMGTAFMFYSNSNRWAEGLEGWHGVDQLGAEGENPNYDAMLERFEARFGRLSKNVVVALAYDTARAAIAGIANALVATPKEVKNGLEQVKRMPCTNGGPATYLTFSPSDHRGYKGDYLVWRELRDGELHFRGYYRPQWVSNTSSPILDRAQATGR
jgi:branched-chain amino acid transport system substrate-binding protein